MSDAEKDHELANDNAAQAALIAKAYATGDQATIDNALNEVTMLRRLLRQGILDLRLSDTL